MGSRGDEKHADIHTVRTVPPEFHPHEFVHDGPLTRRARADRLYGDAVPEPVVAVVCFLPDSLRGSPATNFQFLLHAQVGQVRTVQGRANRIDVALQTLGGQDPLRIPPGSAILPRNPPGWTAP